MTIGHGAALCDKEYAGFDPTRIGGQPCDLYLGQTADDLTSNVFDQFCQLHQRRCPSMLRCEGRVDLGHTLTQRLA